MAANRKRDVERPLQRRPARTRFMRRLVAGVLTIIVAVAVTATIAVARENRPPSEPPWVNNDNTVDMSKLPASLPVVGPDGRALLHPDGTPVMFDGRSLSKGPPLNPATAAEQAKQAGKRTIGPDGVEQVVTTPKRPE